MAKNGDASPSWGYGSSSWKQTGYYSWNGYASSGYNGDSWNKSGYAGWKYARSNYIYNNSASNDEDPSTSTASMLGAPPTSATDSNSRSSPDTTATPSAKAIQPTYKLQKDSNTVVVSRQGREYVLTPDSLAFLRFSGYDPSDEKAPLDLGWYKRTAVIVCAESGSQPPLLNGDSITLDTYSKFSTRAIAKWIKKNRDMVLKSSADGCGPNRGAGELRWLDFVEVGTCNYNSLSQACYSYLDQSSVAYWILSGNCLVSTEA